MPTAATRPGLPERATHDYTRHGVTTLFAALEVATGQVVDACYPRRRHQEFLRFLKKVAAAWPGQQLHVVCDNYATHNHPGARAWLAGNHRVTLHFTPTGCSWLNMVEVFFSIITRQAIRRGSYRSVKDLTAKIGEFIERKVTAEDQLRRIDIRAPQDGMVLQSNVHTVGGVITAGDAIMLIVPQADDLSVEAKVNPQDIDKLQLGNLDSSRDWGHARDFVDGMHRILQQAKPDDYVLATGETHTVREFVELAFGHIGRTIKWQGKGTGSAATVTSARRSRWNSIMSQTSMR